MGPFLAARAVAATGIWMERIGLGWLVWEATGSAGWVGALAFVRLAPTAFFGPWGGVLADRVGSLRVLRASYLAAAAVSLATAVLVLAGAAGLTALLLLGTASGMLQAIANGPMKAALSEVSPRRLLATAIPLGSVTFNLAAFVGPALAGGMLATSGAAPVFVTAALASALFVGVLVQLPNAPPSGAARGPAIQAFAEAAGAAARDPVIAPLLLMHTVFSLLMRPVIDLLPAVAGGLFGGGPETLGLLTAAMGLGALAGSLWLTWRSGSGELGRRILGAACLAVVAAAALALAATEVQAALCIAALGGALVVRAAGGNTVVQLEVEDALRGRVMSIWGTVLRLGSAVGGLALGLAADRFGFQVSIVVAAVLAALSIPPVARSLWRSSG